MYLLGIATRIFKIYYEFYAMRRVRSFKYELLVFLKFTVKLTIVESYWCPTLMFNQPTHPHDRYYSVISTSSFLFVIIKNIIWLMLSFKAFKLVDLLKFPFTVWSLTYA